MKRGISEDKIWILRPLQALGPANPKRGSSKALVAPRRWQKLTTKSYTCLMKEFVGPPLVNLSFQNTEDVRIVIDNCLRVANNLKWYGTHFNEEEERVTYGPRGHIRPAKADYLALKLTARNKYKCSIARGRKKLLTTAVVYWRDLNSRPKILTWVGKQLQRAHIHNCRNRGWTSQSVKSQKNDPLRPLIKIVRFQMQRKHIRNIFYVDNWAWIRSKCFPLKLRNLKFKLKL